MLSSKRLGAVVLVGLLAVGLLVGFSAGDEAVAKEPRATIAKIMVPASAFVPVSDDVDYVNGGTALSTSSGSGDFVAWLPFPVAEVNLRKITLIAYDNTAGGGNDVCMTLFRANSVTTAAYYSGPFCTADSSDSPQRVVVTGLGVFRVNTAYHGPFLEVGIGAPGPVFYGVQVAYSY